MILCSDYLRTDNKCIYIYIYIYQNLKYVNDEIRPGGRSGSNPTRPHLRLEDGAVELEVLLHLLARHRRRQTTDEDLLQAVRVHRCAVRSRLQPGPARCRAAGDGLFHLPPT